MPDPKDSPNGQWLELKLQDGTTVYFNPKSDPVAKKDSKGQDWKLREGTVGYPPQVHGSPSLPDFATRGVVGSRLGIPRIESNEPDLARQVANAAQGETAQTGSPVSLGSIMGRKSLVSTETLLVAVAIVAVAFFFGPKLFRS